MVNQSLHAWMFIKQRSNLMEVWISIGDLQNKEMVGDTWSPTASMRTLKYFLTDASKHKARVHQLDFIGAFFQAKFNNRVFVKLDMSYADYFPEYV